MTPDLETRLELACDPVNHAWRHDRDRLCKRAATELRARAERIAALGAEREKIIQAHLATDAKYAALEKMAEQMAEALGHYARMSDSPLLVHDIAADPEKSVSYVARTALTQFNAFREKCDGGRS